MAYARSLTEILKSIQEKKTKKEKVQALKEHDSLALRNVLILTYDKSKKFLVPDSAPPYSPSKSDESQGAWQRETRKLKYVVDGFGGEKVAKIKRENIFIDILETIDANDAKVFIQMIQKKPFEGITKPMINEAFGEIVK